MKPPPVLLVGPVAEGLAPRLVLSGYLPLGLDAQGGLRPLACETLAWSAGSGAAAGSTPLPPPHPGPTNPLRDGAPARAKADAAERQPASHPAAGTSQPPPSLLVLSPGEAPRIDALRARWGAVPILLGIEHDTLEGRSLTLASGADDFWLSSLGTSDLLTRARLHLRIGGAPQAALPTRYEVADLLVIPSSRQVKRGPRTLALTAREYQLLLLLLEHRGAVLSREQILRSVWQDQQGTASNVIEVYVRYLRQKLEQAGERRLIHTVRGRGYCLSEGLPPPPEP